MPKRGTSQGDELSLDLPLDVFSGSVTSVQPASSSVVRQYHSGSVLSEPSPKQRKDERPLQSGTIIDRYRVESLTGRGGFAYVYRATHLALARTVALKMLRPSVRANRPGLAEQLLQEARNAAKIDHPAVVRVLDAVFSESITYIVMEYIDGRTLRRTVEKHGRLASPLAARLGLQCAQGLQEGLAHGLVHRDLKPSNIMIDRTGQAKIVDFGLARLYHAKRRNGPPRRVAGTPGYIAPERYRDPALTDYRSDIFSLGVTLYEALVGERPWVGDKDGHTGAELPPVRSPRSRAPHVTRSLSDLVLRMMASEPSDRPTPYESLIEELTEEASKG